jgi:glycine oxidase
LIVSPLDIQTATDWCQQHQLPYQSVPSSFEPLLAGHEGKALWLPTVCQVRPPRLMQALRAWLEKNGVTLLEQTALKPLKETEALTSWETVTGEHLTADAFVVTSGAWSFELLKETASKLEIKPMRGQILLYKPQENLPTMVYRDGFYMVPRRDGYLLAGSTLEDVGFDPATTEVIREELREKSEALMPSLRGLPVIKHWSGLRPGTPNNLPTIGPHPQIENLYLNTGHFRYGLTMAPASALRISEMIR